MLNTNDKKKTSDKSTQGSSTFDASKIKDGMPIVCSNDGQFGVVDHMEGKGWLKVRKDPKGVHHYIPTSWIASVDDKVHANRPGDQIMRDWKTEVPRDGSNKA